jgi:hypothetical protein
MIVKLKDVGDCLALDEARFCHDRFIFLHSRVQKREFISKNIAKIKLVFCC